MANQIVGSNTWVQDDINALRTVLNAGHTLRLFTNNALTPTPATVLGTFTEATFPGYSGQILTGDFAASVKILDGEYQILSTVHVWGPPGSGSQTVYGWYIDDGVHVKLSFLFDVPIVMSVSNPALAVQIAYQQWALSVE
jgi:hypothetical protein